MFNLSFKQSSEIIIKTSAKSFALVIFYDSEIWNINLNGNFFFSVPSILHVQMTEAVKFILW